MNPVKFAVLEGFRDANGKPFTVREPIVANNVVFQIGGNLEGVESTRTHHEQFRFEGVPI